MQLPHDIEKLKYHIEDSQRILVTSHISPDPDAVASVILMTLALKLNYPNKKLVAILEEEPVDLDFLTGYEEIKFKPVLSETKDFKPDLFFLLDGNNYERCSRHEGQQLRAQIQSSGTKTVIIDHHEHMGSDSVDVFINRGYPATVQDVYKILFKDLNLKQPDGYAQVTMAGLFADTGGLVYIKPGQHREVFRLTDELVSGGANIEEIANQLSRFSEDDMKMLAELASNTTHDGDYTYSFIRDEVIDSWHRQGKTHAELQKPTGAFLDDYIRNIGGREWGFIVYKNILQGQGMYSVSLRSVDGIIDVSVIASDLGGGGHKPAAGAKFQAGNINDAVSKVKEVIKTHKPTT